MLPVTLKCRIPKRYVVTFLLFVGTTAGVIMHTSMGIAIVAMTSQKVLTNGTIQKPEFEWDSKQKGVLLSLGRVGIFFSPIGGLISHKIGGATAYGLGLAVTAVLKLFTPYFIRLHFWAYAALRLLEGLSGCMVPPSYMEVLVRWAPPKERTRLFLMPMTGLNIGLIIGYQISGYVAYHYSWEYIFYVNSGIVLCWYILWALVVSNQPSEDPCISKKELDYLKTVIPEKSKEKVSKYPYRAIFTSAPTWAFINEYFSWSWFSSFFFSALPLYIKDVHDVNVQTVGIIASIPTISSVIGLIVAPFLADFLRSRQILKIPTVHRIFVTMGQLSAVIFLTLIGLWANFTESIICFSMIIFFGAFCFTSNTVVPIDMFSGYASFIMGLAITAGNISGMLNPIVMGFITKDHSRKAWNNYFLFLCCFNVWNTLIFFFFGSGERQPWAIPETDDENAKDENGITSTKSAENGQLEISNPA